MFLAFLSSLYATVYLVFISLSQIYLLNLSDARNNIYLAQANNERMQIIS